MIKAYDTVDLYTSVRHPDFHIEHQNYADIKDYFTIYTISFKHPRKRYVEVTIRFSDRSNIEELSNYIEINGKIYKYKDIHKNPEKFKALLEHEETIGMIEALP